MGVERDRAIPDRGLPGFERAELTSRPRIARLRPEPARRQPEQVGLYLNEPCQDLNMQGFAPSALRSNWKLPGF